MITESEKQEIINKAVEKALLMLPEVVGNMMAQHAVLNKINQKFYSDHPEFKDKKDIVASTVEMVEGETPLAKYEDILEKSIPKIRERILTMKNLNMENVNSKPNRDFKNLEATRPNPHGEL